MRWPHRRTLDRTASALLVTGIAYAAAAALTQALLLAQSAPAVPSNLRIVGMTAPPPPPSGSLQLGAITAPDSVGAYDKFEITFDVTGTVATNLQMPYDAAPPAGIPAGWGITVNGEFSNDGFQTTHVIPAFQYQSYDYQVKGNRDWFSAQDQFGWKVRFA